MPVRQVCTRRSWVRLGVVIAVLSLFLLLSLQIARTKLNTLHSTLREGVTEGVTEGDVTVTARSLQNYVSEDDLHSGFLVDTEGCKIPDLDPFDVSVRKFIFDEKEVKCAEKYGPPLLLSNSTALYVNVSSLAHYNVHDLADLDCCYTPFWREKLPKTASGNYPQNVDAIAKYSKSCTWFNTETVVQEEFVKTECFFNNTSIYIDYHGFFPSRNLKQKLIKKNSEKQNSVSVMIVGVDSVSRLNFYRQMPQTLKFLKENLSAVEFVGYNKVEDNTFMNLIPVLTGMSIEELKASCWPDDSKVFDDCKFVWDNFSLAGHATVFAEEVSDSGIFQYVKRGFREQPTDYYMRILDSEALKKIGFWHIWSVNLCTGPRKTLEFMLEYSFKFLKQFKNLLSFGLFWGWSLSHDFMNFIKQGDREYKEFLERLHQEGIFKKTILLFMSDHGMRHGGIRQTYQGYLEERLPFLFVVYPDWFRKKYKAAVQNLKGNAHALTVPFDLHETLLDLLNLTRLEKEVVKSRSKELAASKRIPRGVSLFLPIPQSRKCKDAGIVDHWCTCHASTPVPRNDPQVEQAARYLVHHINQLLRDQPQCSELRLLNITSARQEVSTSHKTFSTSDAGVTYYILTIETAPGKGLFEGSVRYSGNTGKFSVAATVSRINLYGDQSRCVPNFKLRLYCYCAE